MQGFIRLAVPLPIQEEVHMYVRFYVSICRSINIGFQCINCSTTVLFYLKRSNCRCILWAERKNHNLGIHSSVICLVEGVTVCESLYHFIFYWYMGGGVRLIGGKSGGRTYHNIIPQYPVDSTVILSNVVISKGVISLKEVGDAQLVGDNWKECIMIPFLPFQKGYNFNLKVIQPLVLYHVLRSQWDTRFGVVINCNRSYFDTH